MVLLVTFFVLFLLFALVDITYLARFYYYALTTKRLQKHLTRRQLLESQTTRGMVLPQDIDGFLHMNNSKYLKEFDLARLRFAASLGFMEISRREGAIFVVNASSIRFRRSMKVFQRYSIGTKLVGWNEGAMFLEQRMLTTTGFVSAIMLTKIAIKRTSVETFIKGFCGDVVTSPEPSKELKSWFDSIEQSSQTLKEEAGITIQRTNSITQLNR